LGEEKLASSSCFVKNFHRKLMIPFRVLDPSLRAQVPHDKCALAVMTKAPHAGRVKTRLVPPLTPDEAAELNRCFLRDTAAAISTVCNDHEAYGVAVYAPTGAESAYVDILPADFRLLPQRGVGLGTRLYFAAVDLFKCGFQAVCLIDSDSPTVPAENFADAVRLLNGENDRVVLGPCADGGYYLIGLRKPRRELFTRIDWSTERVFSQTVQRAAGIKLEVQLLAAGYDVDDAASLHRLCEELLRERASDNIAPHTRKFLKALRPQIRLPVRH
jgi:rSAM/selenodomain-associated transferase 1